MKRIYEALNSDDIEDEIKEMLEILERRYTVKAELMHYVVVFT